MNKQFPKLNDGVAYIYQDKAKRSTFGAKENTQVIEDLEFICKLDFEQMSKREQDLEFASQNGFSLSMKIRTRYVPAVKSKYKVIIDNTLYNIFDMDNTRNEMYLYLERECELDT